MRTQPKSPVWIEVRHYLFVPQITATCTNTPRNTRA